MEGVEGGPDEEGVIPRAFQHIFAKIAAGERPLWQRETRGRGFPGSAVIEMSRAGTIQGARDPDSRSTPMQRHDISCVMCQSERTSASIVGKASAGASGLKALEAAGSGR